MNKVFIFGLDAVNVDNEASAQPLLEQGARELSAKEIAAAGMTGYENVVSPLNTVVHEDGSVTFTPPVPDPAAIMAEYTARIQGRLDAFARTRNYDGIMSVATYATSTNPKFAAEGQYAVEARDATWAAAYAIMDEALASGNIPSWEVVEAALPVLEWPA